MAEIASKEDINLALEEFGDKLLKSIRSMMTQRSDSWIVGEEARQLLRVGSTKLSALTTGGWIKSRGTGRGKRYSYNSIQDFMNRSC